jgi:fructokinase
MSNFSNIHIFGEVLFDCFPSGEKVLGGAPFNVAWHLQAFGDAPQLFSRVEKDELGKKILSAMDGWGMTLLGVQIDPSHKSGYVDIEVIDNEPHYTITPNCAYDFIDADLFPSLPTSGILYHGTLGLRNEVSRNALERLTNDSDLLIFLDVNLRSPWWQKEKVFEWLKRATWIKLNQDELSLLGFDSPDIEQAMSDCQSQFQPKQLILTRGEKGALVRSDDGKVHHIAPQKLVNIVDTVGAGDAFSAVYIHGLLMGWSIPDTLLAAQNFAAKVIGLRGATIAEKQFYDEFTD